MVTIPQIKLHDGNSIPQLGFGVFRVDPQETKRVVLDALEVGYRHLDTAAIYGNEREVGQAIAESGIPREEIFLTTKLWNTRHADAPVAIAESMEKLGVDYLDLYLIHWPAQVQNLYVEAWKDLEGFKEAGLVRSIGVSNFHPEHLKRLKDAGCQTPVIDQVEIHPAFQQKFITDYCRNEGIAIEAWSPLGQGGYPLFETAPVVEAAKAHEKTPAQVVLRWHLEKGYIIFPKSTHKERMKENIDIFDFTLSEQETAAIDAMEIGEAGRQGASIEERGV
ncbi:aldo/keto reductase [Actinotignum urinale]|uniref:aldo/keto reductase n=1 Tax=Actinotignum urinale TaxID=190146 RepID=UPI00280AF48F|nr:aldo/keto reductase [Actinotignum urinale]MDY5129032.1 aldo/keto reductase [Actinotignum urinale]